MSDGLTTDDYGSGVLYDLVGENTTSTILNNYTARQTTGKLSTRLHQWRIIQWALVGLSLRPGLGQRTVILSAKNLMMSQ